MFAQIIAFGIIAGILYSLVASGLALLFGVMKYLNIAHGSFMMIGGYICYSLFTYWHIDPFISILVVIPAMLLLGIFVYRFLLAPLSKFPPGLRMGNSMLVTFGLALVLDNLGILVWTSEIRTVTTSYSGATLQLGAVRLPLISLAVLGLTLLAIAALHLFLSRTYFGKAIRATAQDWETANLTGVNIDRTYLASCCISLVLAGIAGTAVALMYSITPSGGFEWYITAMVVLVLAGLGNIREVFIAGLLLGFVEQLSVFFIGGQYRAVVGLVVIVVILTLRPQGLLRR